MLDVSLLAILQGIAEFLPISSSGHLVIAQHLLGVNGPGLCLDTFLHLGTLFAILAFYRRTIIRLLGGMFVRSATWERRREAWEYLGKIVVSALPAVVAYGLAHDFIESMFENARMVGALLMFTGATLIGTRYLPRGSRSVSWWRALAMGLAQAIALLPGVSRSGMTLAGARGGRVDPEKSAEFSFLMSAPLILGATLLQILDLVRGSTRVSTDDMALYAYGAVLAGVVGYFSLVLLVRSLKGRSFWLFGPYCLLAGLLTLLLVK